MTKRNNKRDAVRDLVRNTRPENIRQRAGLNSISGISRRERRELRKEKLHQLINSPVCNIPLALIIFISVVLIFAEYFVPPGETHDQIMRSSDLITYFFVLELSLRYYVAPNKRIFFKNYWIDILSVLPVLRVVRTVRILRLLRILRLARAVIIMLRHAGWLSVKVEKYFGSFGALVLTSVMLIMCATLASINFDHTTAGHVSFSEFVHRAWEIGLLFISGEVVGDAPPNLAGKTVSLLIALSGLVIFAVFVGTVSASMSTYFRTQMETKDMRVEDLRDHMIICGWDRMGPIILRELESSPDIWRRGVVVIAETDENITRDGGVKNARRLFHVKEDFTRFDILEQCGAVYARIAIVLADKGDNLRDQDRDARTVLAALTLEKLNPKIFTCAELLDDLNATHLQIAGVEEVISRTKLTAGLFAATAINSGIASIVKDVLTLQEGSYFRKVGVPSEFIGKHFVDVLSFFKSEFDATIIALDRKNDRDVYEQKLNPPGSLTLREDDRLVIIVDSESAIKE